MFDAPLEKRPAAAEPYTPISKTKGLPIVSQLSIAACISVLNFLRGPDAIFWAVVAVIVLTFKGKAIWLRGHVVIKVLEAVPALANLNSPAAVSLKRFVCRIIAARHHLRPHVIDLGSRFAVRCLSLAFPQCRLTATRTRVAASESASPQDKFFAATTLAKPSSWLEAVLRNPLYSLEFPEHFSRNYALAH